MKKTILLTQNEIATAADILKKGGVIAFPTETVFGFGVVFDNHDAYQTLLEIKRHRDHKPFTLMCADIDDIANYAVVDEKVHRLINTFMPGPLTLILPAKKNLPSWVSSSSSMTGIRISNLKLVRDLIRATGKPLLVPSANRSNEPPALTHEVAFSLFNGEIDAVIEGKADSHQPSTIVEINDTMKLIREGEIPFAELKKVYEGTL